MEARTTAMVAAGLMSAVAQVGEKPKSAPLTGDTAKGGGRFRSRSAYPK